MEAQPVSVKKASARQAQARPPDRRSAPLSDAGHTPPRTSAPLWYILGMRIKTSITLPDDLLRSLDRAAGGLTNRSRAIEQAVRDMLDAKARADRDARDVDLINRHADRLNDEAADVLDYQVKI